MDIFLNNYSCKLWKSPFPNNCSYFCRGLLPPSRMKMCMYQFPLFSFIATLFQPQSFTFNSHPPLCSAFLHNNYHINQSKRKTSFSDLASVCIMSPEWCPILPPVAPKDLFSWTCKENNFWISAQKGPIRDHNDEINFFLPKRNNLKRPD